METLEKLAKAVTGLASHFKKAAELHKAKATAHTALATAHKGHAEFCKAKFDGMDDGDAHKAYFGKVHEIHKAKAAHHDALSALHKAHAEHLDTLGDGLGEEKTAAAKSAVVPAIPADLNAAPTSVEDMVKSTTTGLVQSALEMLKKDPTVQDEIRKMVLAGVTSALGDKIRPDSVRGVLPTRPGLELVPRPGGSEIPLTGLDPKLAKFVQA
jgi:hypothetical protein